MATRAEILAGRTVILVEIQDRLDAGLNSIRRRLFRFKNEVGNIGFELFTGGLLTAAPLIPLLGQFRDFQDELLFLQTKLKITDEQLKPLEARIRELGKTTSFTALQVTQAARQLAQASFSPREIENSLQATLDLSRGAEIALDEAASLIANTIRTFGLSTSDAGEIASKFVASARLGTLEVIDLKEAIKEFSGSARQLNVNLDTSLALLDVLASRSLKGTKAGTSLNTALVNIAKNSAKLEAIDIPVRINGKDRAVVDILSDLREVANKIRTETGSIKELEVIQDIFNIRAARAITAILPQLDEFIAKEREIKQAQDEAREAAEKRESRFGGFLRRATSALNDLGLAISAKLEGPLNRVLGKIPALSNALSELVNSNGQLVVTLAAIPPLLIGLGLGLLTVSFLAGKLALVFTALINLNSLVLGSLVGLIRAPFLFAASLSRAAIPAAKAFQSVLRNLIKFTGLKGLGGRISGGIAAGILRSGQPVRAAFNTILVRGAALTPRSGAIAGLRFGNALSSGISKALAGAKLGAIKISTPGIRGFRNLSIIITTASQKLALLRSGYSRLTIPAILLMKSFYQTEKAIRRFNLTLIQTAKSTQTFKTISTLINKLRLLHRGFGLVRLPAVLLIKSFFSLEQTIRRFAVSIGLAAKIGQLETGLIRLFRNLNLLRTGLGPVRTGFFLVHLSFLNLEKIVRRTSLSIVSALKAIRFIRLSRSFVGIGALAARFISTISRLGLVLRRVFNFANAAAIFVRINAGVGLVVKTVLSLTRGLLLLGRVGFRVFRAAFSFSGITTILEILFLFRNQIPFVRKTLDSFKLAFSNFFRTLSNAPIGPAFNRIREGFKQIFQGRGTLGLEQIKLGIVSLAGIITNTLKAAWEDFKIGLAPVIEFFSKLKTIVVETAKLIFEITKAIGSAGIASLPDINLGGSLSLPSAEEFAVGLGTFIESIGQGINSLLEQIVIVLHQIWSAILSGLASVITGISRILNGLGGSILLGRSAQKALRNSALSLSDFADSLNVSASKNNEVRIPEIKEAFKDSSTRISQALRDFKLGVGNQFKAIRGEATPGQELKAFAKAVSESLAGKLGVDPTDEAIKERADEILKEMVKSRQDRSIEAKQAAKTIAESIKTNPIGLFAKVGIDKFVKGAELFKNVLEQNGFKLKDLGIIQQLKDLGEGLKLATSVKDFTDKIKQAFINVAKEGKKKIDEVRDKFKEILKDQIKTVANELTTPGELNIGSSLSGFAGDVAGQFVSATDLQAVRDLERNDILTQQLRRLEELNRRLGGT